MEFQMEYNQTDGLKSLTASDQTAAAMLCQMGEQNCWWLQEVTLQTDV